MDMHSFTLLSVIISRFFLSRRLKGYPFSPMEEGLMPQEMTMVHLITL